MNGLWIPVGLAAISAYLLGSINFALVVSRLFKHDDIRTHGSGNAGMTNMLRTFGKGAAAITALGDLLKAVLAIILARVMFSYSAVQLDYDPGYLAGLFVILGHIYPVYFKFKGGKGIMSTLGVIMMVNIPVFFALFAIALPIFLLFRIVSLVSILSAIALPVVTYVFGRLQHQDPLAETIWTALYAILVIYAHRSNIKRLLNGTEKTIRPASRAKP